MLIYYNIFKVKLWPFLQEDQRSDSVYRCSTTLIPVLENQ